MYSVTVSILAFIMTVLFLLVLRQRTTIQVLKMNYRSAHDDWSGQHKESRRLETDLRDAWATATQRGERELQMLWQNNHLIGFLDKDRTYQMYLDAVKARDEAIQTQVAIEQGNVEIIESYENHILGLGETLTLERANAEVRVSFEANLVRALKDQFPDSEDYITRYYADELTEEEQNALYGE